jgi:hypothetical protein
MFICGGASKKDNGHQSTRSTQLQWEEYKTLTTTKHNDREGKKRCANNEIKRSLRRHTLSCGA